MSPSLYTVTISKHQEYNLTTLKICQMSPGGNPVAHRHHQHCGCSTSNQTCTVQIQKQKDVILGKVDSWMKEAVGNPP